MKTNTELQRTFSTDKLRADYQSRSVGQDVEYIFFGIGKRSICYTLKGGFTWRNAHDDVPVAVGDFTMITAQNFESDTFTGHPYVMGIPISHTIESED